MAERAILAYFNSPDQAHSIVPKLKALRGTGISVDRVGRDETSGVGMSVNSLDNDFPGLAYLTLGSVSPPDTNERILLAADADASGLSDQGAGFAAGSEQDASRLDTLLTVSVDESAYEQAVRVIQEAGGRL